MSALSPSSGGDDEGDRRRDFQSLPSREAYVRVAQDAREVRVYRRDARGDWSQDPETFTGGERFTLPALTEPLAVDDVYLGVLDADGHSLLA